MTGAPATGDPAPCTCTHVREAHEHLRRGSDCALCECRAYRSARSPAARLGGLARILRRGQS